MGMKIELAKTRPERLRNKNKMKNRIVKPLIWLLVVTKESVKSLHIRAFKDIILEVSFNQAIEFVRKNLPAA
jgi:hypothetical protein